MARLATRVGPLLVLGLVALALLRAGPALAGDAAPTIKIVEPADGAVVDGPVAVRVEVSNFTLQSPGTGRKPNAGHIHYWIDDQADARMSGPTTRTSLRLFVPPGRHKIRVELVLDDHTSLAEGYRDKKVLQLPPGDAAFERRSSMSTITIDVR
jgi:hypothetical protein